MISIDIERKLHGASGNFTLNVQTKIKRGELVSIYGPSGSGKSSIVRMIAGLMNPDRGS
ncbi:MAG TPA: ATP-binding cassette domain-containing protein, partial [Cyclobacteriaceae bacterium]|nr:ATP-binding cassette domain-containing protein [Cyclobacteriaceae bacterium]